jgi:hypothetical protein
MERRRRERERDEMEPKMISTRATPKEFINLLI